MICHCADPSCQIHGCHRFRIPGGPAFPVPDYDDWLKNNPQPISRLEKAKQENERLKRELARKAKDDLESSEAEKLEKENEDLKKQLGGR
jgi:hypothetical protein